MHENYTTFYGAITDDRDFFELLESNINPVNMLILVESKEDLIRELKKKSYSDEQIEKFVSRSKFS